MQQGKGRKAPTLSQEGEREQVRDEAKVEKQPQPQSMVVPQPGYVPVGNSSQARTKRQHQTQFLAYRSFQHQSKKYYLDVKANKQGKFIMAAKVDVDGSRSNIMFSFSTAVEVRDHLKRARIIIPDLRMTEWKSDLLKLIDKFGTKGRGE